MSRITEQDIELMNFWETELIDRNWEEYDYCWWKTAYCYKCRKEIKDVKNERCENCKAFIC